jgi:NAD(P)-dependent dehydrogenase (short-subunit alcohol dehydrogenase family)
MKIADTVILVTGANRGLGRALVGKALRRGAKRVYAGTRQPLPHSDGRVTPLTLSGLRLGASAKSLRSGQHLMIPTSG